MNDKKYKIDPFQSCLHLIKTQRQGIRSTEEYSMLSGKDKRFIEVLIRSNELS
jgi:hypothetical protein